MTIHKDATFLGRTKESHVVLQFLCFSDSHLVPFWLKQFWLKPIWLEEILV